jgi:hypothetical protein
MALFKDEFAPVFYFQGYPVYWTTLFTALHSVCFLIGAILLGSNYGFFFLFTSVSPSTFPYLWTLLTNPFFDPYYYQGSGLGCLYFLWMTFIFYDCGMNVERHMGGKSFVQLYFFTIIIPSIVVAIFCQFFPLVLCGIFPLTFGALVANATIFPDSESRFGISMLVFCWILIIVNSALDFAVHDIGALIGFWVASFTAYCCMRLGGAGRGMDFLVEWKERGVQAKREKQAIIRVVKKQDAEATLDSVLEKISRRGMASLTPSERAILQKASSDLQKRDRR